MDFVGAKQRKNAFEILLFRFNWRTKFNQKNTMKLNPCSSSNAQFLQSTFKRECSIFVRLIIILCVYILNYSGGYLTICSPLHNSAHFSGIKRYQLTFFSRSNVLFNALLALISRDYYNQPGTHLILMVEHSFSFLY